MFQLLLDLELPLLPSAAKGGSKGLGSMGSQVGAAVGCLAAARSSSRVAQRVSTLALQPMAHARGCVCAAHRAACACQPI